MFVVEACGGLFGCVIGFAFDGGGGTVDECVVEVDASADFGGCEG